MPPASDRTRPAAQAARLLATVALLAVLAAIGAGAVDGAPNERIGTAAGSAGGGFAGDGGSATNALLTSPSDVGPLSNGAFLIADTANHRIRRVDAAGIVTTVAGAGPCCGAQSGFAGEGTFATSVDVRLNQPRGVSPLANGAGFLIADTGNHRVRKVENGVVTTVAGTGAQGFGGDGDAATGAQLNAPGGVAALPDGGFLIADTGNHRIRRVSPSGIIATVAGATFAGFAGDGGPAGQAALRSPARVVPLTGGGFLIADTGNHRIRRVTVGGTISTVAGSSGTPGFGGDGGPANKAQLNAPEGLGVLPDGSIAIADTGNERVRLVGADGRIRTLAGTGTPGLSGDGGDPEAAELSQPRAVAAELPRVWIADALNHRVRVVNEPPAPPDDSLDPTPPPGVSPPVLGKSVVAKPRLGRVLVRLPGTRRFVALASIANLPLGAELDAGNGSVVLFFTTNGAGRRAKAIATGGNLILNQPAEYDRGQRPGELILSGRLRGCETQGAPVEPATAAAAGPLRAQASTRARVGRRLKVRARGRIRTRGRYGAATVRGTRWSTIDRCPEHVRPGTLVVVSRGKVAVRAFVLRRTVLVPAGTRYLAPARRA